MKTKKKQSSKNYLVPFNYASLIDAHVHRTNKLV